MSQTERGLKQVLLLDSDLYSDLYSHSVPFCRASGTLLANCHEGQSNIVICYMMLQR